MQRIAWLALTALLLWGMPAIAGSASDVDGDGVPDNLDNCSLKFNPAQDDTDGDYCGNICDCDYNQNGAVTIADFGQFSVVFEPRAGGRIFERGPDGAEHEWGQVTAWDAPHHLAYRWHIFLDPGRATTVEVTFEPSGVGTRVRLVNDGFEVFGDGAGERAGRVGDAWAGITDRYRSSVDGEFAQEILNQ